MKKVFIYFIKLYQKIPGPWHELCRHNPSCSNYAIEAIEQYGFKGLFLTIKRILRCNPWGTFGYDPVPRKESKNEKIY